MKNYIAAREARRINRIVRWGRRHLPRDDARHWPTVEMAWKRRHLDELTAAIKRHYPVEVIRQEFFAVSPFLASRESPTPIG